MIKFFLTILLIPTFIGAAMSLAHAAPDGAGNDIFTGNVGIGTTTPRASFIVASGNVGIGTWDPTSAFQVVGTVSAASFSGSGTSLTSINAGGFVDDGPVVRLTTSSDNLGVGTTAANTKLLVYGGNVGIGTVAQNPAALLNISSKANQDLFRIDDNGDSDSSPFLIDSNGNVGLGTMFVSGAGLTILNGNIGIGTFAEPNNAAYIAPLQIRGNVYFLNNQTPTMSGGIAGVNSQDFLFGAGTLTLQPRNGATSNGWFMDTNGNVGFGTNLPQTRLAITNGNVGIGTWTASGGALIITRGNIGIGTITPGTLVEVFTADNTTAERVLISATQANVTAADHYIDFNSTTGNEGSIAGTGAAGVIAYNTFTGSHWTKIDDKKGLDLNMVLEATGEKFSENKQQLVKSRITKVKQSKYVYGVYGGTDLSTGHDLVLALGTGYIWVANTNGDIKVGDYLQSSSVFGHAEKQDDNVLHNYTVAKAMEIVNWKKSETRRLIACTYHAG